MSEQAGKILLCIAATNELKAFYQQDLPKKGGVLQGWNYFEEASTITLLSGMGAVNSACAVYAALNHWQPRALLHVGLAGAHLEELALGDVIVGLRVVDFGRHVKTLQGTLEPLPTYFQHGLEMTALRQFDCSTDLAQLCLKWLHRHRVKAISGVIGSADQFNRDPQFIVKVQNVWHTHSEDMESSAVAQVAHRFKTPYCGIRIIANNEINPSYRTTAGSPLFEAGFLRLGELGRIWRTEQPF